MKKNVCAISGAKILTYGAWNAVEEVMRCIQKNPVYNCGHCTYPINDEIENSIQCDSWKNIGFVLYVIHK